MSRRGLKEWLSLSVVSLAYLTTNGAVVMTCDETALRAAIAQGGTITFGCDGTIPLSNPIIISTQITLDGSGHSITIRGTNSVRLFQVQPNANFTLKALTLADGRTNIGAAIYSERATVNLANCALINNTAIAELGRSASGGAIFSLTSSIVAVSCVFSNNQARGGNGRAAAPPNMLPTGAGNAGAISDEGGQVNLTNCQFVLNSAIGGEGAAGDFTVGVFPQAGGAATGGSIRSVGGGVRVVGTTFQGNTAASGSGGTPVISGQTPGVGGMNSGGAVAVFGSTLELRACTFLQNSARAGAGAPGGAASGGALAISDSSGEVAACNFSQNAASGGMGARTYIGGNAIGGALFCERGRVNLLDCHLAQNGVEAGFGRQDTGPGAVGLGGGLYNSGTSTVTRVLIASNSAVGALASGRPNAGPGGMGNGGGAYNAGALNIRESALMDNIAQGGQGMLKEGLSSGFSSGGDGKGGAIYNAGQLDVLNTTLAGNSAVAGPGGVAPMPPPNPPVYGPAGSQFGGAIFNNASCEFINSTIARNSGLGATVYAPAPLRLKNSIVALSTSGEGCSGTITDGGGNISSDNSCGFSSPSSRNNTNPQLAALGNNGGPTPTMALLPNSPAIDAADDSFAPLIDQRGVSRPQGPHADIGAFEATAEEIRARISIQRLTTPDLAIHLVGRIATSFALLSSMDLKNWTSVVTNTTDASGRTTFIQSPSGAIRFYRAQEF